MITERNGPPPERRPAPRSHQPAVGDNSDVRHSSSVRAAYFAPNGRRTSTVAIVGTCPRCSAAHLHRLPDGSGWRRAACGARYWLAALDEQAVAA